jgi:hypothetical protein
MKDDRQPPKQEDRFNEDYDFITEQANVNIELIKAREQKKQERLSRFPFALIVYKLFETETVMKIILTVFTFIFFLNTENMGGPDSPFKESYIFDFFMFMFIYFFFTPIAIITSLYFRSYFPAQILLVAGIVKAIVYRQLTAALIYISAVAAVIVVFEIKRRIKEKIDNSEKGYIQVTEEELNREKPNEAAAVHRPVDEDLTGDGGWDKL